MADNKNPVYTSRLKNYIQSKEMRCDGDLPEAAGEKMINLLNKAVKRARANDRKTVRPEDL